MNHIAGCPQEADPQNETCDCAALRVTTNAGTIVPGPLWGHTSPETAYLVADYPYGYRLRCKIRYWIEFRTGVGYRFCSQTTNPKVATEMWNKPKCSTYNNGVVAMYLDEKGHVQWAGCSAWNTENLEEFVEKYSPALQDALSQTRIKYMRQLEVKRKARG